MNSFTAVLDACVLFSASLRDLLLWLATNGVFRARWSQQLLDEWTRNLLAKRPDVDPARIERTCRFMNAAIMDAMVTGHEPLIAGLDLPDRDDRHVMAKTIERYLVKNDFIDDGDLITAAYHEARDADTLPPMPEELKPHTDQILALIDTVFSENDLPQPDDDRKPKTNPLNANFKKKEFQELWSRINCKAIYKVAFDSQELVGKAIDTLDRELKVTPLQYIVERGEQNDQTTHDELKGGKGFRLRETDPDRRDSYSVHSQVTYDLLGELAESTKLTRRTIAAIMQGISPATFALFKQNPEHFLSETARLINEQKATVIIERLSYDPIDDHYDTDIFTATQVKEDFSRASQKLQRHIYDYVITDSKTEREFVTRLDTSTDVVVYAKLPRGFRIPTPVGNYNPDWAISFKEGAVKHVYFIAETKGSMSSLQLRDIEKSKIACARKFFKRLNKDIESKQVQYDVVDSYDRLMDVVSR